MMRLTATIVCLALLASSPALARATKTQKPAGQAGSTTATSAPRKPAAGKQAPVAIANAYAAMPMADRLAIQADLAWIGDYEGPPGGDFADERVIDAVKLFQKAAGGKETGILSAEERTRLAAAATGPQAAVGWRLIDDPATGARFGLPDKLVSATGAARLGSRWASGRGQIQVEDFALSEANLPALFEEEKKTPKGRHADWSKLDADSFVISGTQGLKNFVVRAQTVGGEIRGITVLYDQATEGVMTPTAIAIANSFEGFPDPNAVPPEAERAVGYATAIAVDRNGDLLTTQGATTDCEAIMVPGFGHAVRIAADKAGDLALIRLYGARTLQPAPLIGSGQTDSLTLVGIADPLAQQGGDAVSKVAVHLDAQAITPAPPPGFSGAAAIDAQGRFAGIVELKSPAIAGLAAAAPQASLIPADGVRAFLAAHGVSPAANPGSIDQSVVRVICVRK
jgi:peptidoglycan hydrolase-like protein with peptidoglycan-binding domain